MSEELVRTRCLLPCIGALLLNREKEQRADEGELHVIQGS